MGKRDILECVQHTSGSRHILSQHRDSGASNIGITTLGDNGHHLRDSRASVIRKNYWQMRRNSPGIGSPQRALHMALLALHIRMISVAVSINIGDLRIVSEGVGRCSMTTEYGGLFFSFIPSGKVTSSFFLQDHRRDTVLYLPSPDRLSSSPTVPRHRVRGSQTTLPSSTPKDVLRLATCCSPLIHVCPPSSPEGRPALPPCGR